MERPTKAQPCHGCLEEDGSPKLELACGHRVHVGVAVRVPRNSPARTFFNYGHAFACVCTVQSRNSQTDPLAEPTFGALCCPECARPLGHVECCQVLDREVYLQYGVDRETAPAIQKALATLAKGWCSPSQRKAALEPQPDTPPDSKVKNLKQLVDLIHFYKESPHPRMGEILTEAMVEANLKDSEQDKAMDLIDKLMNGLSIDEKKPASGVGYGGESFVLLADASSEREKLAMQQQTKDMLIANGLKELIQAIAQCGQNLGAATEAAMRKEWGALSCLAEYLGNGVVTDILHRYDVYQDILNLCVAFASNPMLVPLMLSCKPLKKSLKWSAEAAQALAADTPNNRKIAPKFLGEEVERPSLLELVTALKEALSGAESEECKLITLCNKSIEITQNTRSKHPQMTADFDEASSLRAAALICNSPKAGIVEKSNHYKRIMKKYAFRIVDFETFGISHAFAQPARPVEPPKASSGSSILTSLTSWTRTGMAQETTVMSKDRMMAIKNTVSTLRTSLPVEWYSSIFCIVDERRYDLLKFLIIGPDDTPYQDGCFMFDLFLGPGFPETPPRALFLTTGGGRVRFNPNLYEDGKVCLSLLGTWHGPKWNPKESTVLQVLLSLQSLVLVNDPLCNEPGYEDYGSNPVGRQRLDEYNLTVRQHTLKWATLDALTNPPAGFEDVVRDHFRLKKAAIIKTYENSRGNLGVVAACSDLIEKFNMLYPEDA